METTLWNRKTKRRIAYRRVVPAGLIHLPREFSNAVSACRIPSRYVRILTKLSRGVIHADFDFMGSDIRPPCEGQFDIDLSAPSAATLSSVMPNGVKRRCEASVQCTGPLTGWLYTGYDDHRISPDQGVGFYDVRKAYFLLRTKTSRLVGMGRLGGRVVSFQLGNSVYHDDSRYNDNVLFLDGKTWPLPPVRITRPHGLTGEWYIQDTESMVDLTFTPISDSPRYLSAFVIRTEYHTVYGLFDGVLLTGDGEQVSLRGFPGIGKKILLRL